MIYNLSDLITLKRYKNKIQYSVIKLGWIFVECEILYECMKITLINENILYEWLFRIKISYCCIYVAMKTFYGGSVYMICRRGRLEGI